MDSAEDMKGQLRELCADAPPEAPVLMRLLAAGLRERLLLADALEAIAGELEARPGV